MSILSSVGSFFALDINSSGIRVVHLRRGGKTRQLVSFGSTDQDFTQSLDPGSPEVMKAIPELLSRSKISTSNVAIAAPPSRTFITVTDTPLLKGGELDNAIKAQASQLIPNSLDEVKLDWAILGKSQKDESMQEVLVATIDKRYVEERVFSLEKMGLNVIAVEPEPIAMVRALTPQTEDQSQAVSEIVLNMGLDRTDLVVVDGGQPRLVRSFSVGGSTLIRSTSQTLDISEEQAEQLFYKVGLDQSKFEGRVYNSVIASINLMSDEIEKSIKYHNSRYPNSQVGKVVVTGILSRILMLPQHLADRLQMNIEIGNTWMNVGFPETMYDKLMSQSSKYSVAVGLALRVE